LVAAKLDQTGAMWERYNVVDPQGPTPGRYAPQRGFGWTNGVFAAMLIRIVLRDRPADTAQPDGLGDAEVASYLPTSWPGTEIYVHLPSYPWPTGTRRTILTPPVSRSS